MLVEIPPNAVNAWLLLLIPSLIVFSLGLIRYETRKHRHWLDEMWED